MNTINKKLTKLIAGRTVKQASHADGRIAIEFTDGSVMKIKSADPSPECAGRTIKVIRQRGADFEIEFGEGFAFESEVGGRDLICDVTQPWHSRPEPICVPIDRTGRATVAGANDQARGASEHQNYSRNFPN